MNPFSGFVPLVLASTTALGSVAAAQASPHSSDETTTIDLEALLAGARKTASLDRYAQALKDRATAQTDADARFMPGPTTLALEGEAVRGADGREARIQATIKKAMNFGVDAGSIGARYTAEADADLIAKKRERREQELELAKLYVQLRQRQAIDRIDREILGILDPLVRKAKAAAQRGTIGGFFATRWQLMVDGIRTDLEHTHSAYKLLAETLGKGTGVALPAEASGPMLPPLGATYRDAVLDEAAFLPAQELRLRQKALAARATQAGTVREVEALVGATRDFATKANGIVVGVDIPLGIASAASSEARALDAEQSALRAETDYALTRARAQAALLAANTRRLADAQRIAEQRIANLTSLLAKAQAAFTRGQGEIGEVIETAKELHEAKLKLAELGLESDESVLTLTFFAKGDQT